MALTREQKVKRVEEYTEQLAESQGIILVDYRGLSVGEMEKIRRSVRPIAGEFKVVKNRLLNLALEERGMSLPEEWLTGPTAVSFCREEIPPVAKALVEAGEETDSLALKGGASRVLRSARFAVPADDSTRTRQSWRAHVRG